MGRSCSLVAVLLGLALVVGGRTAAAQSEITRHVPQDEHFATRLGITYRIIPYGRAHGALVTRPAVPNSLAARIGLEPGDIITEFDDQPILSARDVHAHAGRVTVRYIDKHTGQERVATISLPPPQGPYPQPAPPAPYALGITVAPVSIPGSGAPVAVVGPAGANASGPDVTGLRIDGFTTQSPARDAGLEIGDVILMANGRTTDRLETLGDVLRTCRGTVRLTVRPISPPYENQSIVIEARPTGGKLGLPRTPVRTERGG